MTIHLLFVKNIFFRYSLQVYRETFYISKESFCLFLKTLVMLSDMALGKILPLSLNAILKVVYLVFSLGMILLIYSEQIEFSISKKLVLESTIETSRGGKTCKKSISTYSNFLHTINTYIHSTFSYCTLSN